MVLIGCQDLESSSERDADTLLLWSGHAASIKRVKAWDALTAGGGRGKEKRYVLQRNIPLSAILEV